LEKVRNNLFAGFSLLSIAVYVWCYLDIKSAMTILAPPENRELGLTEIAQGALLLVCLWAGIKNARGKSFFNFWIVFSLFIFFIFLEEIDYGLHYVEFLLGKEPYALNFIGFRNIHNQGNNNNWIKLFILICQIILFGILPFIKTYTKINYPARSYGFFYLFITLSNPLSNWLIIEHLSALDEQVFEKTQLLGELRELAYYLILVVFISEYREEINHLIFKLKS